MNQIKKIVVLENWKTFDELETLMEDTSKSWFVSYPIYDMKINADLKKYFYEHETTANWIENILNFTFNTT